MRSKIYLFLYWISLPILLTACGFTDLMRAFGGAVELDLSAGDASLNEYSADVFAQGPDGSILIVENQEWGSVVFRGLLEGEWEFSVLVRDKDSVLLGFAVESVQTESRKTVNQPISVNLLETETLLVSIEELPAYVGVGRQYSAEGSASGGTGNYEYFWYEDGDLVGTGSILEVYGTLSLGEYTLEAYAVDTTGNASGFYPFTYTVYSPYEVVEITDHHFTLSWSAPVDDDEITMYELYYREHGTFDWDLLGEIRANDTLEYTIYSSATDLGAGSWDFGLKAISDSGEVSEMHSCLDTTAAPTSGWYLEWRI